jgi:hypothetical protein
VNVFERTGKFLGAYTSRERAFDAGVNDLTNDNEVLTFGYELIDSMSSGQITVEEVLNGKNDK